MLPEDYCDLNRRFVPLATKDGSDELSPESYESNFLYRNWRAKKWKQLYENTQHTIILGEQGSGRSYEFKAQCNQLTIQGKTAFYIELHRLVTNSIEEIVEGSTVQTAYNDWLKSNETAYFFLDAVDEAKLDKSLNFQSALESFRRSLGTNLANAVVFISSRISSWIPSVDDRLVEVALRTQQEQTKESEDNESRRPIPKLGVYVIAPLDREAVQTFANSSNVSNSDAFIAALDHSHAWEFARRPLDVTFLLRYWNTHGEIGNLRELLEETIHELLKERSDKPDHAKAFALSIETARIGAESMAAASVLCRTLDFSVVDRTDTKPRRALSPMECLPQTWDQSMCHALIDRPIFDSAIYGTVRFHHRRLAEYLAACWLRRRMENHCPAPALRDLLFNTYGSRKILRPSLASVAVWLTCLGEDNWSVDLRKWILDAAPESFLQFGDPSKLNTNFKKSILDAFAERYKDRKYLRFHTDRFALSRLADNELGESLSRKLLDNSIGDGPRLELLKVAVESRCQACIPAALEIARTDSAEHILQSEAIKLIEKIGDAATKSSLKEYALEKPEFTKEHLGILFRALFPDAMSVSELMQMIRFTPSAGRLSTQRYFLAEGFEKVSPKWCPFEVVEMLCELNQPNLNSASPHDVQYPYSWTRALIRPALEQALQYKTISNEYTQLIAQACWLVAVRTKASDYYDRDDEETRSLDLLTREHPKVRTAAFWFAVEREVAQSAQEKATFVGRWAFNHKLEFETVQSDFDWLLEEIGKMGSAFNNEVAVWMAYEAWESSGKKLNLARRLIQTLKEKQMLSRELRRRIILRMVPLPPQWYWTLKRKGAFSPWYWKRKCQSIPSWFTRTRDRWNLHTKIGKIRSGEYCGWLVNLCRTCDEPSKWAVSDWSKLNQEYGHRITNATQEGCIAVWKQYTPEFGSRGDGVPNGIIAGLSGLQLLYQTGKLEIASMSSEDAIRAAKYAINELNGHGEWIGDIADIHKEEVKEVLLECILVEWNAPESNDFWPRHLEVLASPEVPYTKLILEDVLELFLRDTPANQKIISTAFRLLRTHGRYEPKVFGDRAAEMLASTKKENPQYMFWLAMCIQTNAEFALNHLEQRAEEEGEDAEKNPESNFMVELCVLFSGRRETFPLIDDPDFQSPQFFERFFRLVYRFVNPTQDPLRTPGESFRPNSRDDAQSFRSGLLSNFSELSAPKVDEVLEALKNSPEYEVYRDWLLHLLDQRAEKMADGLPHKPSDVREFEETNEVQPNSSRDLFRLAIRRLIAIKHDVEDADQSIRTDLREDDKEVHFRRFIARELNRRRNGLYTCPQESVIRDEERLDIRVENPRVQGHIVIEAKVADINRSLSLLLEDLEGQLSERYLKDQNASFGVYLIGHLKNKKWKNPDTGLLLCFEEVIQILSDRADQIAQESSSIEGLEVLGIDFRQPQRD